MSLGTRLTAALAGDGRLQLVTQSVPALEDGHLMIRVHRSLISPGSELGGWHAVSERRRTNGTGDQPAVKPFGYSNAGIVEKVGAGCGDWRPGMRVAAIGNGYALHSTCAVVPHHLCVPLADNVSFEEGAYAMLMATAMHGVRRAGLQLGEYVAVAGLGILGQLAARLCQIAGCYVIGWDPIARRREGALALGIDAVAGGEGDDVVASTRAFTRSEGLDAAILAHSGDATLSVQNLLKTLKCTRDGHPCGVITVLGHVNFPFTTRPMSNVDIRLAFRTGAGYHDKEWERGSDYPPVYMRWTTSSNLSLCMRYLAERRLDVSRLTTHRIALSKAEKAFDKLLERPDEVLGVIFEMDEDASPANHHGENGT